LHELFAPTTNNDLLLSWGGSFNLQSAADINGPFTEMPGATSPFYMIQLPTRNASSDFKPVNSVSTGNAFGKRCGETYGSRNISVTTFYMQASTNLSTWTFISTNPSPISFIDANAPNFQCAFIERCWRSESGTRSFAECEAT
jgi:hypothetical protein